MNNLIKTIMCVFIFFFLIHSEELNLGLAVIPDSKAHHTALSICNAISAKMGKTIKITCLPNKRLEAEMKSGNSIVGDLARVEQYKETIKNTIQVKEPLIYVTQTVYTKNNSSIKIENWNSLQPYKVIYLRGTVAIEKNAKNAGELIPLDNIQQAFNFLLASRGDVVITNDIVVGSLLETEFKDKGIIPLSPPLLSDPLYTFFLDKYPDYAKQFEEALISIKKDGTYKKALSEVH